MRSTARLHRLTRALRVATLASLAWFSHQACAQISVALQSTGPLSVPGTMKTVDFGTTTLANVGGLAASQSIGSGGSITTQTTSHPQGFSGAYLKVTSGTSTTTGSTQTLTFSGSGTSYVTFLWNLGSGNSELKVTFTLSDGSTVTVANCAGTSSSCVGSYDSFGLLSGIFSILLGDSETYDSLRLHYKAPAGKKITKVAFTSVRWRKCTALIFCSNVDGNFRIDSLSFIEPASVPSSGLHHLEILSNTSEIVSCETSQFRVRACANASCSSLYPGTVTGSLSLTGIASGISYPSGAAFTIPAGAGVSNTVSARTTTAGTAVVGSSGVSPLPDTNAYCSLGTASASNASGACNLTVKTAGLKLSLPDHRAGTPQTLSIKAIKASGGSCLNVGTNVTLPLQVTAVFPTLSGVKPTLGGTSLISGVVGSLSTLLSGLGEGASTFQFNDVGRVRLQAAVPTSGLLDSVLSFAGLTGNLSFVVAPASFLVEPQVSGNPVTVVKAGQNFSLKISALNNLGNVAGNFGSELGLGELGLTTAVLKPAGRAGGAVANPAMSLPDFSFANGIAVLTTSWQEVGSVNIAANLPNYLGSAMNVAGNLTGTLTSGLKFVPDRFKLTATPQCSSFTYAGQPFSVELEAVNTLGQTTLNYDGTQADPVARRVTLEAVSGAAATALSGALAATAFADGVANTTLAYTAPKLTGPVTVEMQARDDDDVRSNGSAAAESGSRTMRFLSGRVRLSNAFGSEKAPLQMPVQLQYWSGRAWVPSTGDTCTSPATLQGAVARANYLSSKGAPIGAWVSSAPTITLTPGTGIGYLTLPPPLGGTTGTVDVTLDLSAAGVNMPWLQSLDDRCGASALCNPKARATFGVYTPESKKTVHVRDVF